MKFSGKKVLVCGIAKSGVSAAVLLKNEGALVTLQDIKNEKEINPETLSVVKNKGISLLLGKNPDDIINQGDVDILVMSPGIPLRLPFIALARQKGIPVIGEFELGSLFCQSPIAAITGTNGKTTTTAMLGAIMAAHFDNTVVVGNIGTPFTEKAGETTAEGYCIAEVSSFQLETIKSFRPRISAILNLTPDHLDRHGSFEGYVAAKKRIFENQWGSDILVLNRNDKNCAALGKDATCKVLYFSSVGEVAEGAYLDNGVLTIQVAEKKIPVMPVTDLKVPGVHNYENAMAAALMAYCAGVPIETIQSVLKAFRAVPHRIEYVATINDIEFFNDSKGTNPDAAIKSIEAMSRPIVLIGGGYDKNADFTQWIRSFNPKVRALVVTGQVADKVADTAKATGFSAVTKTETFEEAVQAAWRIAEPGDAVLLSPACASWDMFDSYEQRGDVFKALVAGLKG